MLYLATPPAPLNEFLWEAEDNVRSDISSQREWALEDRCDTVYQVLPTRGNKTWWGFSCVWIERPTCCRHSRWQPAPRRASCWTTVDACSKRLFRCRFLPCCPVQLCGTWVMHTHIQGWEQAACLAQCHQYLSTKASCKNVVHLFADCLLKATFHSVWERPAPKNTCLITSLTLNRISGRCLLTISCLFK